MQRNQNVYFVGRILNKREDENDNAQSFRFSKVERASLKKQLKGIPVQMEHEDNLKVGEILKGWDDKDDNFYVYGRLSGKGFMNTFAKHAVQPKGGQKPYYGSLSLSHVHRQWKDGRTQKAPIEVSLVVEPRRRNCDIVWVSNNKNAPEMKTNDGRYIGTVHAASDKATKKKEKTIINMATLATQEQTTPAAATPAAQAVPAETPVAAPEAAAQEAPAATGIALNEQVFSEMSQLYEKEKSAQEELQKLKQQLAQHQSKEAEAKQVKQKEEEAKSRALISSMLEHMRSLLGSQSSDVQNLEPHLMKLGQNNPAEINQLLEVVSKASKKYQQQELELKSAQNSLNEKTLELKFQKLIKQHGIVPQTTTEVASSRKRAAPVTQAAPAVPVKAATQAPAARNPYLRTAGPRQGRRQGNANNVMNKDLLNAFMSNRAGGARQSMAKLHTSLQETMQQRSMFPGRY